MRWWGALLLALAGSCATPRSAQNDFMDEVRDYQEGLRWKRYDVAASHLPPADREAFLDRREELDKDLRIDEYEIKRVKLGPGRATVQVEYKWHLDSEGIVHESVADQTWELRGKFWILIAEVRRRGDEMPGLDEPPEEPVDAAGGPAADAGP